MISASKECTMHEERQSIGLSGSSRAENRIIPDPNHADLLDLQIRKSHEIYDVATHTKHQVIVGVLEDNKVPFDFNSRNSCEPWTPYKSGNHIPPNQHFHNNASFCRFTNQPYSPVSGYTDSGYESQAGGDAQSLSAPSHVESAPELSGHFGDYRVYDNPDSLRCEKCKWTAKTQSQKKKHDARHRKDHKCEEDGCDAGFGTKNDLERHRKAVHNKSPLCGPTDRYKCFGKNCAHPSKVWPRLDNFQAHLSRKHGDENREELLAQSKDWHEKWKRENSVAESTVYTITPSKTLNNPDTYFDYFPENFGINGTRNEPVVFDKNVATETASWPVYGPAKKEDSFQFAQSNRKLPGLQAVLNPTISEECIDLTTKYRRECTPERGILPSVETFERGIALMQALTVATLKNNGNQMSCPFISSKHTSSAGTTSLPQNLSEICPEKLPNISQLSNEDTKMCFDILSKLHSTLKQASNSETSSPGANREVSPIYGPKQEGFKCAHCKKMFSRQSILKKHERRHEKPYGCTFAGCYGIFGSKADWKRHESMQHYHVQCFRCSRPRGKHTECAMLFFQEEDFIQHLNETHQYFVETKVQQEIDKSRIGAYDHQSKFYYWCGFCKKIKLVEKKGVEAWNERFDHIETEHFLNGKNIKQWVPAKGHTMKGARKKRVKIRNGNKTMKKPGKRSLEDSGQALGDRDNAHDDKEVTIYDVCSSSEDDTDIEAKQLSNSYDQKNKIRKKNQDDRETSPLVYCCDCQHGPQFPACEKCPICSHEFCSGCSRESCLPGAN